MSQNAVTRSSRQVCCCKGYARPAKGLFDGSRASVAPREESDFLLTLGRRHYFAAKTEAEQQASSRPLDSRHDVAAERQLLRRARQKQADKEFFADLLSSAATKRDAKTYLSRLLSPHKQKDSDSTATKQHEEQVHPFSQPAVNLGSILGVARAVDGSLAFTHRNDAKEKETEIETLHVALVKLTAPENYTDDILEGIARTLSQLSRLSMAPCVVLDVKTNGQNWRTNCIKQADRLLTAIDNLNGPIARRLDNIFSFSDDAKTPEVLLRKLLMGPLLNGQIPVIMPIAYSTGTQKAEPVSANSTILALTREFAGLNLRPPHEVDPKSTAQALKLLQEQVSLDRIIVVDESGGIPRASTPDEKQVFVNLEQEFSTIQNELKSLGHPKSREQHQSNMELLQKALLYLPPSSSALITTPWEAANRSVIEQDQTQVSNVGTRRPKNTLIHNLLTDKPAYSSSLPSGRLSRKSHHRAPTVVSTTTFVKKGMPVTIIPDPNSKAWAADNHGQPRLKLTDPLINLPRLVHLINDSFNRPLDVENYLNRVNDRIAGIIIVGDYEGGALLTWETPPGALDTDTSRLVPYLDKFAVLKRSQGAGGVADILFNAMVRTCFPNGVCWRSRKDNPVNKWYFERSRGTWKLPDTNWTMFWTTPGVVEHDQVFLDYEGVCRGVQPSWADKKHIVD